MPASANYLTAAQSAAGHHLSAIDQQQHQYSTLYNPIYISSSANLQSSAYQQSPQQSAYSQSIQSANVTVMNNLNATPSSTGGGGSGVQYSTLQHPAAGLTGRRVRILGGPGSGSAATTTAAAEEALATYNAGQTPV